jgi:tripartite-type tricarboxylate transporter receptor subunit TctC
MLTFRSDDARATFVPLLRPTRGLSANLSGASSCPENFLQEVAVWKLIAVAALAFGASVTNALAQSYPSRPVTMIVPFPAGGPSDTLARILVEALRGPLGQPVVIENVSGAGGSLGTGRVARSAPDGYTLSLGHVQTHVMNAATQNLPFDVVADFEPVSLVADTPQWIVAKTAFAPKDLREMIAWLKANPGKGSAGSVGVGGPSDVAAIYFQKNTGTTFQLVPYRGGAPLIQDLIAGQIDFTFGQAANYLGPVRSGQLKPYAVLAARRWWAAPDVPTIEEAGGPSLPSTFWHGIWVPKGTPKDVIAKLNSALVEALADPNVKKRFADIGQEIWPRDQQAPQALAAQQKTEIERWWPIIKAAGIKTE